MATVGLFVTSVQLNTTDGVDDVSNIPYPGHTRDIQVWEIVVKCVFYLVMIIFSIVGNVFIIVIVYRHKRMHNATNYYMINLAVADLMVAGSCTWVHAVDDATDGWVLGAAFCKFNSFSHGK